MISSLILSSLIFQTPTTNAPAKPLGENLLKIEGDAGIRFQGFCVVKGTTEEKKFDGVAPAEIHFDVSVEKCTVTKGQDAKGIKLRFFHQEKTVYQGQLEGPTIGISFVIPFK